MMPERPEFLELELPEDFQELIYTRSQFDIILAVQEENPDIARDTPEEEEE